MKDQINTILKAIGLKAVEVSLMEMKLDDGVTTIEAEAMEAGQEVNVKTDDDQRIPLPMGEYKLEDGQVLVVQEEGIIAEVKAEEKKEEEPAEEPKEEAPVAASEAPAETPVAKKVVESVSKETFFSKEEVEAKDAKIAELEALITELSKQEEEPKKEEVAEEVELSVKPVSYNPENETPVELNRIAGKRPMNTKDRVYAKLFN